MAKRQRRKRRERRQEHAKRPGWRTKHSVITGAGLAAGAAIGFASPAAADPLYLTVDNLNDPNSAGACDDAVANDCSLRQAITDANTNSGQHDYIYFQSGLTGTISLTTAAGGQIPITDSVYIIGNGPQQLTVHAASNSRIFNVDPANAGDRVEIDGITLTGGNAAAEGGAIFNDDSRLRMFDAVLTGNTAGGPGGAIYEVGNYDNGADDVFAYVTFTDNHASHGGAIGADVNWGTVGAATFSGNSADSGDGGAVYGGTGGSLVDATLSGNQATGAGGGVSAGHIGLYGTILANNTGSANADLDVSDGYAAFDLVKDPGDTGIGAVSSVITGQDPQLGGLALNGGYLPTLKPAAGSPVVDQSYSYAYTDERGSERVVDNPNRPNAPGGNGADIGAVELTLAEGPQVTPAPPPPTPVRHKKKCKKKHKRSATSAKKRCKKKHKRSARSHGFHFRMPPAAGQAWPDAAEHHPFRLRP